MEPLSPHIAQARPRRRRVDEQPDAYADFRGMPYDLAVARLERLLIEEALLSEEGSVTKAAERLGIERSRLGKIRKRLGIE